MFALIVVGCRQCAMYVRVVVSLIDLNGRAFKCSALSINRFLLYVYTNTQKWKFHRKFADFNIQKKKENSKQIIHIGACCKQQGT